MTTLLHYRPWRGRFRRPVFAAWPIARVGLSMILRRKLFWGLYALALMVFLMFFFGQYLLAWAETQAGEEKIPLFGISSAGVSPVDFIGFLRVQLKFDGKPVMYTNFFWYQGYIVMVVLALAGAVLVGNDFRHGSLPFYLAKPLEPWHYILGKSLAVAVFVNMMTTLPAVVLFVQYGFLYDWGYLVGTRYGVTAPFLGTDGVWVPTLVNPILPGILGYGAVLTVTLSLLLVATAGWLRRSVPLIMLWTTTFLLFRLLAGALVDGLRYDPRWRLIDLWNDTYLLGNVCFGVDLGDVRPRGQPTYLEAALVLGGVCLLCLTLLTRRIRAVEVVT